MNENEKVAGGWLAAFWLFPSLRWLIPVFLIAIGAAWGINVLGDSTALNSPDIYYSGTDPVTGKLIVVKGCRPERLMPDGTCDRSITIDTIRRSFPSIGNGPTAKTEGGGK